LWAGVLRMAPAPLFEHQRALGELIAFLVPLMKRRRRGTLVAGANVFNEASRKPYYRLPDLTFVSTGRDARSHGTESPEVAPAYEAARPRLRPTRKDGCCPKPWERVSASSLAGALSSAPRTCSFVRTDPMV
jgi:hypothetical protein